MLTLKLSALTKAKLKTKLKTKAKMQKRDGEEEKRRVRAGKVALQFLPLEFP